MNKSVVATKKLEELLSDDVYKKEFGNLLEELKEKSFVARKLLKQIEERKIILISSELMSGFLKEEVAVCACGYFFQLGKKYRYIIAMSKSIIKNSLRDGFISDIELGLAHELGHIINLLKELKINSRCKHTLSRWEKFEYFIKPRYNVCPYKEYMADQKAIKIISDICGGIENWKVFSEHGLIYKDVFNKSIFAISCFQGRKCMDKKNCPFSLEREEALVRLKKLII